MTQPPTETQLDAYHKLLRRGCLLSAYRLMDVEYSPNSYGLTIVVERLGHTYRLWFGYNALRKCDSALDLSKDINGMCHRVAIRRAKRLVRRAS